MFYGPIIRGWAQPQYMAHKGIDIHTFHGGHCVVGFESWPHSQEKWAHAWELERVISMVTCKFIKHTTHFAEWSSLYQETNPCCCFVHLCIFDEGLFTLRVHNYSLMLTVLRPDKSWTFTHFNSTVSGTSEQCVLKCQTVYTVT